MKSVTELKDFDVTKIVFSKKTPSQATGRYFCFVNNSSVGTSKWFLQTPMMCTPFGVSQDFQSAAGAGGAGGDGKNSSMKLTLSFGGDDPDVETCRQKLYELEQRTIDAAVENSTEWFGKALTREVVESMFFPLVKRDPEMQWPDTFSVKIPTSYTDGSVLLDKLYSFNPDCGEMVETPCDTIAEHIVKRTNVQVIFSFSQLYFTGARGFGISLKANIIRFVPNINTTQLSFLDDSMVTVKSVEKEPTPEPTGDPEPAPEPEPVEVDDDDDSAF